MHFVLNTNTQIVLWFCPKQCLSMPGHQNLPVSAELVLSQTSKMKKRHIERYPHVIRKAIYRRAIDAGRACSETRPAALVLAFHYGEEELSIRDAYRYRLFLLFPPHVLYGYAVLISCGCYGRCVVYIMMSELQVHVWGILCRMPVYDDSFVFIFVLLPYFYLECCGTYTSQDNGL